MRFDINEYKGKKISICCTTHGEVEKVGEYLQSLGIKWASGGNVLSCLGDYCVNNMVRFHYEFTGNYDVVRYRIDRNPRMFTDDSISRAKRDGYEVLYYEDFDWGSDQNITDTTDVEIFLSLFQ